MKFMPKIGEKVIVNRQNCCWAVNQAGEVGIVARIENDSFGVLMKSGDIYFHKMGCLSLLGAQTLGIVQDPKDKEVDPKLGRKFDQEKPRWDLLPWEQVEEVVKVLTHGAKKYDDDNWQKVPDSKRRYFAALHRHLNAWHKGEKLDKDSNLPHLASVVCCALFLMWHDEVQNEKI